MRTILLQSQYFGGFGASETPSWVFPVVIAGFVLLLVAAGIWSRRSASASPGQQQKYSRATFARAARNAGLSKPQTALLERLLKVCKIKQPMYVFTNSKTLDDLLKRGIYAVEAGSTPEEAKQAQLNNIYRIKQLIDANAAKPHGNKTTSGLKAGQQVAIMPEAGGRYPSKIVTNMREMLAVAAPKGQSGQEQRWRKGTRCKVIFWRDNDAGYAFVSKVVGYNTVKGVSCMFLQHSRTLRREQQRHQRRKSLSRPCFFYPIRVMEVGGGRRQSRKAVVQYDLRAMGTIVDISAGGCSIRTRRPLKRGALVKIELEIPRRDTLTAFGKLRRVREERMGGMMHVMFTKVSGANLNKIYSFVYDYTPMG